MRVVSTHPSDHRHTNALKAALKDIEAPGWAVVFGDRRDMLEAALDLHYSGIKLVHVGGGDTPHGTGSHPDHRTRDAISMLARVHCVANAYAAYNLRCLGHVSAVYITGSPGLDEVVRYAATLDPEREREGVFTWYPETGRGWTGPTDPEPHRGPWVPSDQRRLDPEAFLHNIAYCKLFRTNSSAGLYEAPILGTPVELVGDRQQGRRGPYHDSDGKACYNIRRVILENCDGAREVETSG